MGQAVISVLILSSEMGVHLFELYFKILVVVL